MNAPLTPEREAEHRALIARTTDLGALVASPGVLQVLLAELDRVRTELAARPSRAEVLRQEGDAIVKHCPDHGPQDQDGVWMNCHCAVADEMRRRAGKTEAGTPTP